MPEMNLKQLGFTYRTCGPFKIIIIITITKKLKATGDPRYIYRIELDKLRFQHDMAYGSFKDLPRTMGSDNCYVTGHLQLLVIEIMMDINEKFHQWSTILLIRRLKILVWKKKQQSMRIKNWAINNTFPSPENLKDVKCVHLMKIIFGVMILQTPRNY